MHIFIHNDPSMKYMAHSNGEKLKDKYLPSGGMGQSPCAGTTWGGNKDREKAMWQG